MCAVFAAVVACSVLAGTSVASVRSPGRAPSCNRSAVLPLNQSTGSVQSLLAPVLGASFNVCAAAPSAAVRTKLAALKALYRTNRSLAHKRLLALLVAVRTNRTQSAVRSTAATGCDGLDQKIQTGAGGIPGLGDLLAAARTAELAGDTAGDGAALAAAGAAFASWGDNSGVSTVGDWFAIAQGAFELGDEALAQKALASAQATGIDLKQRLTPSYLGGGGSGSVQELTCLGQLDHVLALFNPAVRCAQMPSASVVSGIAGRSEQGPQSAAGVSNAGSYDTGGTLIPDLDCAYVDAEITQTNGAPFAGAEIQLDYEQPQAVLDYAVATFGFGAWSPVSGVGTDAYGYTSEDNGVTVSALQVWVHYTTITLSGFGSLGAYEAMANSLIAALKLG